MGCVFGGNAEQQSCIVRRMSWFLRRSTGSESPKMQNSVGAQADLHSRAAAARSWTLESQHLMGWNSATLKHILNYIYDIVNKKFMATCGKRSMRNTWTLITLFFFLWECKDPALSPLTLSGTHQRPEQFSRQYCQFRPFKWYQESSDSTTQIPEQDVTILPPIRYQQEMAAAPSKSFLHLSSSTYRNRPIIS